MSNTRSLEAQRLVRPVRCECGNRADGGGIYPCDSDGHRIAASDLVYCDRCDRITVRETGALLGYRSFVISATTQW